MGATMGRKEEKQEEMAKYDYSKLRGRIVEKFGTCLAFAEAIGSTNVLVSNKLNNKSNFSRADIELWSNLLDIPSAEYDLYFFTKEV